MAEVDHAIAEDGVKKIMENRECSEEEARQKYEDQSSATAAGPSSKASVFKTVIAW